MYVVFIEAGLRFLKADGHLAYICPHKFFNSEYGQPLRKLISSGKHLRHVVHFGDEQVFAGATIYTCLLFLTKAPSQYFHFIRVNQLTLWNAEQSGLRGDFEATTVTDKEWNFVVGKGSRCFARLAEHAEVLGQLAHIFVGLQTSADDIYILSAKDRKRGLIKCFSKALGEIVELEEKILHPIVSGVDVDAYRPMPERQFILFPYSVIDETATLIPFAQLDREFPKAASYLRQNRKKLEQREGGKFSGPTWYRFSRSQNLGIQGRAKLCVPRLVNQLHAGLDEVGTYCAPSTTLTLVG